MGNRCKKVAQLPIFHIDKMDQHVNMNNRGPVYFLTLLPNIMPSVAQAGRVNHNIQQLMQVEIIDSDFQEISLSRAKSHNGGAELVSIRYNATNSSFYCSFWSLIKPNTTRYRGSEKNKMHMLVIKVCANHPFSLNASQYPFPPIPTAYQNTGNPLVKATLWF